MHWGGGIRNGRNISNGKSSGKRPLERPRHRRKDNIKLYTKEICVYPNLDRDQWWDLVNTEIKFRVP